MQPKLIMAKYILFFATLFCLETQAQKIKTFNSGVTASLRGLSVVSDNIAWISGSNGTVGKTTDGGITWEFNRIKGFEGVDFRDIEAFDGATAIVMGIASPSYILKTTNGGQTWRVVYQNKDSAMFLDAMEFWNEQSGIVIGDPIKGRMFFLRTFDEGETWKEIPEKYRPQVTEGEACFASSGTNIVKLNKEEAIFVTGGKASRLFIRDKIIELPIVQGTESTGANSLAVNKKTVIVVGGDFANPKKYQQNCVISNNMGKKWKEPTTPPKGYRSCVAFIKSKTWVTCGLTGVDISTDNGDNWLSITNASFHACAKAKTGNTVYFCGTNGAIGKLEE